LGFRVVFEEEKECTLDISKNESLPEKAVVVNKGLIKVAIQSCESC